MDKIKILVWLKWRTTVNAFKKASILAKILGIIVYIIFLFTFLSWIYIATRQKIDFYVISALLGLGILIFPFFEVGGKGQFFDQTKDLKRYFHFPINNNQILISITLQNILSIGELLLIPLLIFFILCLSVNISNLILFFIILFFYLIFCLLIQNIGFIILKLYKFSNLLFLFIFFLLFFSFGAILMPEDMLKSFITALSYHYSTESNPFIPLFKFALLIQKYGEVILRVFPTSIFGSLIMDVKRGNYSNLLPNVIIVIFLLLISYIILLFLIKKILKSDLVEVEKKKFSLNKEKLIEYIENKISIFKETKGLVYLQIKSLYPKCFKGMSILIKYYMVLFLFIMFSLLSFSLKSLPHLYIFIFIFILFFPLMNPYLTNYLGVENKGIISLISFPINRKKFILQQNLIVFIDFILSILFLSFLSIFFKIPASYLIAFILISIPLLFVFISFGNITSTFFPQKVPERKGMFFTQGDVSMLQGILLLVGAIIGIIIILILIYPILYLSLILITKINLSIKIISYAVILVYSFLLYLSTFNISLYRFTNYEKKILEKF